MAANTFFLFPHLSPELREKVRAFAFASKRTDLPDLPGQREYRGLAPICLRQPGVAGIRREASISPPVVQGRTQAVRPGRVPGASLLPHHCHGITAELLLCNQLRHLLQAQDPRPANHPVLSNSRSVA